MYYDKGKRHSWSFLNLSKINNESMCYNMGEIVASHDTENLRMIVILTHSIANTRVMICVDDTITFST